MLRTRVITGAVLAPLAFLLIFGATPYWFGIIFALLLLIGSWEFRRLGTLQNGVGGWLMLVAQALLFYGLLTHMDTVTQHATALLSAACLVWLLQFLRLTGYRPGEPADFQFRILSFASSLASLSFCWIALITLRTGPAGSWWLLVLLLIIWSADTGAYFSGRAFGKRKLAPEISPSKTVEGFLGGTLAAVLVGLAAVHLIPALGAPAGHLTAVILVTAVVSAGGDLYISLHKRRSGIKDSGGIFPGHGGVLDRLDSLLAGAPYFVLGKLLLGF